MKTKRKFSTKALLAGVVVMIFLVGSIFYLSNKRNGGVRRQTAQAPSNWKTYDDSKEGLSFKYPSDWFIKKSTWGGRNNYAILYSNDKSQCIGISVSSDNSNLDEEIRRAITGWGEAIPENTVVTREEVLVNGKQGLIEEINYEKGSQYFPGSGNHFFAGSIDFGVERIKLHKTFIILTSCSLKEQGVFSTVFSSIQIK